jgi:hypothetical protein
MTGVAAEVENTPPANVGLVGSQHVSHRIKSAIMVTPDAAPVNQGVWRVHGSIGVFVSTSAFTSTLYVQFIT